jgi:regulator of protease activity HflC (stomatin/prohibitin superfamily)
VIENFSNLGGLGNILLVIIVLVVLYTLFIFIRIVPQYERLVVFSLGRYAGTRGPGVVLIIPFIERAVRVDTRERFLEIPRQTAISKDNTTISIDFLMYYRVVDPSASIINVDDVVRASLNVAATTLRAVIGDIELDDVLAKREQINDVLRVKLDEITERWGLKITRVEIREVEPPRDIQEAMNRQMSAERERRATVTRASGEREASIAVAEGEKQASILRAEGLKQSSILQAEGERQSQLLRAQGFAAALQSIDNEAREIDANTMALQYLETLQGVGSSLSTKFVLPMEMTGFMQQIGTLMQKSTDAKPQNTNGNSGAD